MNEHINNIKKKNSLSQATKNIANKKIRRKLINHQKDCTGILAILGFALPHTCFIIIFYKVEVVFFFLQGEEKK